MAASSQKGESHDSSTQRENRLLVSGNGKNFFDITQPAGPVGRLDKKNSVLRQHKNSEHQRGKKKETASFKKAITENSENDSGTERGGQAFSTNVHESGHVKSQAEGRPPISRTPQNFEGSDTKHADKKSQHVQTKKKNLNPEKEYIKKPKGKTTRIRLHVLFWSKKKNHQRTLERKTPRKDRKRNH